MCFQSRDFVSEKNYCPPCWSTIFQWKPCCSYERLLCVKWFPRFVGLSCKMVLCLMVDCSNKSIYLTGKCVISKFLSKKMEPARFWLLWLINIHDHSKVTSLFPSSFNFSPSWFFIFKRSFIHLVLSGNRLVASLCRN